LFSIFYKQHKESFTSTTSKEPTSNKSTTTESSSNESTSNPKVSTTTEKPIQPEFLCNNYIPNNLGDHIDNVIIPIKPTSITPNNYLKINDAYIRNNTTYVSNNTPINTYKKQPNFIKDLTENKVLVNPYINRDNFVKEITEKQQKLVSLALNNYFKENSSLNKDTIQTNSLEHHKKLAFKDNISDYFEENNLFDTLFDSGNGEWDTGTNEGNKKVVCDFKPF